MIIDDFTTVLGRVPAVGRYYSGVGSVVDISGDDIIIGAPGEDLTVNENNFGDNVGAAYNLRRNEGGDDNWGIADILVPIERKADPNNQNFTVGQNFGYRLSMTDQNAVFAAQNDDRVIIFVRNNLEYSSTFAQFDSLELLTSKDVHIWLKNVTNQTQNLSDFTLSSEAFSYQIDETTVSPSDSVLLTITFTPLGGEEYNESFTFIDDEGNGYRLSLFGKGIIPYLELREKYSDVSLPSFVNVIFQVTTQSGNWLEGYGNLDLFEIKENDASISPFESIPSVGPLEGVPVKIQTVLLLDNSFSIGNNLDDVKEAARTFVRTKRPDQEIAIYSFSELILLQQDFTTDTTSLMAAIDGIPLGPASTNLYGAIIQGSLQFGEFYSDEGITEGITVVFTDGEDTQGQFTYEQARDAVEDKTVFAIGVGDNVNPQTLIQTAGLFRPNNYEELAEAFIDVQERILEYEESLYWFTYVSPKRGNSSHSLELSIPGNKNPNDTGIILTEFSSDGFSSVPFGLYVNRTFLTPNGISELSLSSDTTRIKAESLFGLNPPSYVWTIEDESVISFAPEQFNNYAQLVALGSAGESTTLTVSDVNNTFSEDIEVTIGEIVTSSEHESEPISFELAQNYPNPFNPNTNITYSIGVGGDVKLEIYNVLGKKVATIVNEKQTAGMKSVQFDASALSSGVYFYRLVSNQGILTKKMMLIK